MRHRVSLRQIEGFLLASTLLSFSRAAEAMHITQSAFSQLIRELESSLGVQLFDRTTRRTQLSAPGKPLQKERWVAVIDAVGSHTLANACAQTRYRGVVAACGLAQGIDFPASVAPFILRGVSGRIVVRTGRVQGDGR